MGYPLDEPVLMAVLKPMQTEFGIYHKLESCVVWCQVTFIFKCLFSYFLCKLESWSSSMHSIKMKVTHASKCCAIAFAQNVVCAKALLWLFTTDVTILRSSLFEARLNKDEMCRKSRISCNAWMDEYVYWWSTLFPLRTSLRPKSLRIRTLIYWCLICILWHLSTVP